MENANLKMSQKSSSGAGLDFCDPVRPPPNPSHQYNIRCEDNGIREPLPLDSLADGSGQNDRAKFKNEFKK